MYITKKDYNYFLKWYEETIDGNLYDDGEKSAINRTIVMLGIKDNIENDIFKSKNKRYSYQMREIEKLIKKQYNRQIKFESIDMYLNEIKYMNNLDDEEKRILEACIKILL